jgi:hypothetical protein
MIRYRALIACRKPSEAFVRLGCFWIVRHRTSILSICTIVITNSYCYLIFSFPSRCSRAPYVSSIVLTAISIYTTRFSTRNT